MKDSKHFASHTGGFGNVHYEYPEELTFEQVQEQKQERAAKKKSRKIKPAVVKSADEMEEKGMPAELFYKLPQASIGDISEGTKVIHRIFGEGLVEDIGEIDEDDPGKAKVTVKFETFELPKKLVFRHAKLALQSGE